MGVQGSGVRTADPQKLVVRVFYGSDPDEKFTERNLIPAKSTPGAVFKHIKRSKSPDRRFFVPDPTGGACVAAIPRSW